MKMIITDNLVYTLLISIFTVLFGEKKTPSFFKDNKVGRCRQIYEFLSLKNGLKFEALSGKGNEANMKLI